MIYPKLVLVIISALLIYTSLSAGEGYEEARRLSESGDILPLEELLPKIQKEQPGRILELELESKWGRYLYEVELLDEQGAVWEFKIDALTGEILERELED
ncbi:MAG: PepSY domain-containing protein [Candidatus Thiodiazotropha sp.]